MIYISIKKTTSRRRKPVKWLGIIEINKPNFPLFFLISFIGFFGFGIMFLFIVMNTIVAQYSYLTNSTPNQISELFTSTIVIQYIPALIVLFILTVFCFYTLYMSLKYLR